MLVSLSPDAPPPVLYGRQGQESRFTVRKTLDENTAIHLHGLAFVPVRSNLRSLPPLWTDTMLLLKDEVIDIALVADNPGDRAFRCHVIEHQKTGVTGFLRVT